MGVWGGGRRCAAGGLGGALRDPRHGWAGGREVQVQAGPQGHMAPKGTRDSLGGASGAQVAGGRAGMRMTGVAGGRVVEEKTRVAGGMPH